MGVSADFALPTSKRIRRWSIYAVWEREMLCDGRSWLMAMPNANHAGPRSKISHFFWSKALNDSISLGEEVAAKMLSMWMEKMMVPEGDEW
jgi:hypothetical protein